MELKEAGWLSIIAILIYFLLYDIYNFITGYYLFDIDSFLYLLLCFLGILAIVFDNKLRGVIIALLFFRPIYFSFLPELIIRISHFSAFIYFGSLILSYSLILIYTYFKETKKILNKKQEIYSGITILVFFIISRIVESIVIYGY